MYKYDWKFLMTSSDYPNYQPRMMYDPKNMMFAMTLGNVTADCTNVINYP